MAEDKKEPGVYSKEIASVDASKVTHGMRQTFEEMVPGGEVLLEGGKVVFNQNSIVLPEKQKKS